MAGTMSELELARQALAQLPETADTHSILTAVHQRLDVARHVELAKQVVESRQAAEKAPAETWFADALGCLMPILCLAGLYIAMPLLFSLGDRLFSPPPRYVAEGTINALVLTNGANTTALQGKTCRVTYDQLLVDSPDNQITMIPNNAIVQLVLQNDD